jgi:hypothetical protein
MRCEQFEQRLQRCLDRRQGPSGDSALRRHASDCPQCRETLAACARLVAGLDLLELPVPDEGFSQRVVDQIRIGRRGSASTRRLVGAILAVAACLLLAWLPQYAGRDNPVPWASEPVVVSPIAASMAPSPGAESVRPTMASPTGLTADVQIPLVAWTTWPNTWSLRSWNAVDKLAGGLTPITTPLGVAVEGIRRTIPLGRDERPKETSRSDSVRRSFRRLASPLV